jgi:putative hemolysin
MLVIILLVALETSFTLIQGDNLERLVQKRSTGARRLESLQRNNDLLIFSILTLRVMFLVTFMATTMYMISALIPSNSLWPVFGSLITMFLTIIIHGIGYIWGQSDSERIALNLTPLVNVINKALAPLTKTLIKGLIRPILNKILIPNRNGNNTINTDSNQIDNTDNKTDEDPRKESSKNLLGKQILRGSLRLESMSVKDIMVPRPDIISIGNDKNLTEGIDLVVKEGYSRIPLYEENIDNIKGVIYAKDLLEGLHKNPDTSLEKVARAALLIPETKMLSSLLKEFQEKRVQIALVIDEYGSVSGLITNEDLLEEIVGEIEDEFTVAEPLVEQINEETAIIDARTPLQDVSDLFKIDLEAEGSATLGGLIYDRLGRMPHPGDTIQEGDVHLRVLTTAGRRIRRVRVNRIHPEDTVKNENSM